MYDYYYQLLLYKLNNVLTLEFFLFAKFGLETLMKRLAGKYSPYYVEIFNWVRT